MNKGRAVRSNPILSLSLAAVLLSCTAAPPTPPPADEGYITVPGGRIYWSRMGNGPGTPLVVIHGGPGSSSFGLKGWSLLGDDRPVIRYDQLGSGKSDHPTDTTLYTVDRYVRELQALRDSLGLTEVHLYGRSWGAMLLQAYMGTNPSGVRSVTFSSPLVTTARWEHDADSLIRFLPDSMQRQIAEHEAAGTTDHPEYQAAMEAYYAQFLRRTPLRFAADADSARQRSGGFVYRYMWGPSEFTSTGTLKTFDGTDWLRNIRVPALFVTGEFDEATPAATEEFSRLVPGSEFAVIPGAGHATENDNPEAIYGLVREFLRRAETP